MTNRTNEIKANKQAELASIPIPEWREVDDVEEEDSSDEEDISNASFALRHVIYELEERNRRFQYLAALEKGGGVTIIDIKGILEELGQRSLVIQHEIYKKFLDMVKDHYSNLANFELDTDEFVLKVRALITDNAILLNDLLTNSEQQIYVPSFDVVDELEVDESTTGRNYWHYFTTKEEYESEYEDKEDEEFTPSDDSDAIIEIVADEDIASVQDPEKRKRGRPRKLNQPPAPLLPANIKRKRGRPRKNMLIITTQNLEALALEAQKKDKPVEVPTTLVDGKRKRGRPPKKPLLCDSLDDPEYFPTITEPPPFELFSEDLQMDDKKKRGRSRRNSLIEEDEFTPEEDEFTLSLSDSNSSILPETSLLPDSLDSFLPDLSVVPPQIPEEFNMLETLPPPPKRRRGRPRKEKIKEELLIPPLEDCATHQSNSDIESPSTSPSSMDSPMIGTPFSTLTCPKLEDFDGIASWEEEEDDASVKDDDEDYNYFSDNSSTNSPIQSPRASPVFNGSPSPTKRGRAKFFEFGLKKGRPRKKPLEAKVAPLVPPTTTTGNATSYELSKKTRHARNKIADFAVEDLLDNSEDDYVFNEEEEEEENKPKRKRRSSLDYGERKYSPKATRVRVSVYQ